MSEPVTVYVIAGIAIAGAIGVYLLSWRLKKNRLRELETNGFSVIESPEDPLLHKLERIAPGKMEPEETNALVFRIGSGLKVPWLAYKSSGNVVLRVWKFGLEQNINTPRPEWHWYFAVALEVPSATGLDSVANVLQRQIAADGSVFQTETSVGVVLSAGYGKFHQIWPAVKCMQGAV